MTAQATVARTGQWGKLMTIAGSVAAAAWLFDFVAPVITAIAVLYGAAVFAATRARWGTWALAAMSLLVAGISVPHLVSKGLDPSEYGLVRDFVGIVVGGPAAAVALVACIGRLTTHDRPVS